MKLSSLTLLTLGFLFFSLKANAQDLYDINNITLIDIVFVESDWDAIMDANNAADDGTKLIGTVTINGTQYSNVGVAFKGNSTYNASNAKNPLNIELDYVSTQRYQGYETLKLSSGKNDPSFIREVLSYEIGRKYMDMPLSNYAKVTINGTYYGLFSSSESIDGRYGERRIYANKNNTRFKCNPVYGSGASSLQYLGADSAAYLNSYELKSDLGWNDLVTFTYNITNDIANAETFLDVDRALWMLAFDNVTVNLDSYIGPLKQNYYLFIDDNGRWVPIIWDLNEGIGGFENLGGGPPGPPTITTLTQMDLYLRSMDATYPLVQKLLSIPRYKKMYLAHVKTIVEENISNNWYYTRGQELQAIIATEVQTEPNAIYSYANFVSNLDNQVTGMNGAFGVAQVLNGREAYLTGLADWSLIAPTITPLTTIPAVITPNSTVTFTANILNATSAYLGYRTFVGNKFEKIDMFDDGLHGDGAAGDGVYGASIFVGASDIEYYFYADNADAAMFSPVRAEHEFYNLHITSDVVINEMMPKNGVTASDEEGKYEDWIELYNNSSAAVDISNYYLSDNITNPNKWQFPAGTTIQANGFLIVWCDQDTLDPGLHANFKLSSGGETLILSNSSGFAINQVTYPEIESSSTYGRYPNGTGPFIRMAPTYNATNSYTAVSLAENVISYQFSVYPNPTNAIVNLALNNQENLIYNVYNLTGELVLTGNINEKTNFDVSNFSNGVYIISVPELNLSKKLVKN